MKYKATLTSVLAVLALSTSLAGPAQADYYGHAVHWRGDIHRFHGQDFRIWRGGQWRHSFHNGRLGWWWVTGGLWYFYPAPVYPYPDPYIPPVLVSQPPVVVTQSQVDVMPPPPPAAPASQSWYFCDSSQGYYPYVQSCAEGWRPVPATPSAPR
ncbi:MAG: hypothetical protein ACLPXB_12205 [Thiobacillaceae bacterium]